MAGRGSTPNGRDAGRSGGYAFDRERNPDPVGARAYAGRPAGGAGPAGGAAPGGGAPSVTGSFPAAYARVPDQEPPRRYAPDPGGRGRRTPPPRPRGLIDYPRWGRTGWTRWFPSWKLVSAIIGTGLLAVVIALGVAYANTDLPPEDAQASAQTSVIYFSDGKTPIGTLAVQNRQNVELAQVPVPVRDAVLAAEDRTFYSNSGIDPTSIARAAWSNVRGNSLQGGSTISQQYVKNVYDERDVSLKRKAKEIFLAVKVNRQISKDDILERYLNTIYLGDGAYGIQAASRAYFNKDVGKLTVSEGAFLAGIINAPSLADPRDGAEQKARAVRRWNVVLDAMVVEQKLAPAERAAMTFPKFAKPAKNTSAGGQNGYLMDLAKAEVEKNLRLTEEDLETGGYRIVTTFNQRMVKAGVKAITDSLPEDRPKRLEIGMASVDPRSGAIRAIYGGKKYVGSDNNNATLSIAQAGSTFKAFGLIAALEDGVSLRTQYNSRTPMNVEGRDFKNFDTRQRGYIDLVEATEDSVNTVYAQLNDEVGPPKTVEAAIRAGIPDDASGLEGNLANVLGSTSPHAIDMAAAYATFAAEGIRRAPYCVERVTLIGSKKELWEATESRTKGKRAFDADAVADLTYALQQVVRSGSGSYAGSRLDRPAAGKTGTSSDSRSAWFVGYTPQLSTAVMMYELSKARDSNVKMKGFGEFDSVTGAGYPVRIWTRYMEAALRGSDEIAFPEPAWVGEVKHSAPVQVVPTSRPRDDGDGDGRGDRDDDGDGGQGPTGPDPRPSKPGGPGGPDPTPTEPEPTQSPQPSETDPGGNNGGGPGGPDGPGNGDNSENE